MSAPTPFGPPNLWPEIATSRDVGRGGREVEPLRRLHRVGVHTASGARSRTIARDLVDGLAHAGLVVDEHHRHDRGALVEPLRPGVEVDDTAARSPADARPETLALQPVARAEHGLVLDPARHDAVERRVVRCGRPTPRP